MLPVLPLVVFAQAQTPRYFTNAENVRRIAAGKAFVAFATSGGVRVFTRSTQSWRVYTKNEGLPSHNIHDVVFDAAQPDKLWVLCGSWGDFALGYPEPDLQLITLDLATGKVASVAPPTVAPRTARRGYPYFLDYSLSVSESWATVFAGKGAALAWDRGEKKWTREINVEATPPRPNVYPGHVTRLGFAARVGELIALYVQPKAKVISQSTVVQSLSGGAPSVVYQSHYLEGKPSILLYNQRTNRLTRHDLSDDLLGQSTVSPLANRTSRQVANGWPLRFLPDTRPDSVLIESLTSEWINLATGESSHLGQHRVLHRVSHSRSEPVEVSREPIMEREAASLERSTPGPPLLFWTDYLVEGDNLWVSGYNDSGLTERRSGIARLDLATGKWDGPKVSPTGIPANFVGLYTTNNTVRAGAGYFLNEVVYNPAVAEFQPSPPVRVEPEKVFESAPLQVPGTEGTKALAASFGEGAQFFLTEELAPGERRGAPIVLRLDTTTGALKRYPERLFHDVSVAEQRRARRAQQTDLKGLSGSFLKAAGATWLHLDRHLFRYDAPRDTWIPEGTADALSPEGETALWKSVGPDPWRTEFPEARRLRGEVLRWSAATSWQKLNLGEDARSAGSGVLYQNDALWLSGVGVLRIPKEALRFVKPY